MLGPFPQGLPWAHKPCPRVQTHPKSGMFPCSPAIEPYLHLSKITSGHIPWGQGFPFGIFQRLRRWDSLEGAWLPAFHSLLPLPQIVARVSTTISNTSVLLWESQEFVWLYTEVRGESLGSPQLSSVCRLNQRHCHLPYPRKTEAPPLYVFIQHSICYFYRSWWLSGVEAGPTAG